ncbi:MAG: hypothetical protein FWE15_03205 [Actinomycetia bacterium]|nr:hypothetical protein [Actinomycetes bacterium]MCL2729018.1 hypothetical protein [Actinomycetes bacterium]
MRSRRSVRLAAVGTAALVAGVLPGTNSAASGGQGELSLSYACQFASGEQDVTVAFAEQFPQTGDVGKPIVPGDLSMAVTIPRAGVTAMLPSGTGSVSAEGDLKTRVTQGTSAVDTDWPGLAAEDTSVAGTDDLVLTLTGKVPGVTVSAAGDVTFSVGELALTLHPQQAAGGTPTTPDPGASTADTTAPDATAAPADTGSADVTGTCTPAPDQDPALATVHVPGTPGLPAPGRSGSGAAGSGSHASGRSPVATGSGSGTSSATTDAGQAQTPDGTIVPQDEPVHSGLTTCGKVPIAPLDPARLPPVNPGAVVLPQPGQPPFPPVSQCGFAVGFSNVNKLKGAMIVNDPHDKPAMAEINSGQRKVLDWAHQYIEVDSIIALTLPPSHSTFLTYGFMPTTADVEFVPRGVFTVVQVGDDFFNQPILTTIGGYQDIRIHNVKINGTPLDVGPNCHTATPVDVVMHGRKDGQLPDNDGLPDYDIKDGGPLTDDNLVIPPFTGCASHGEDLDALFTSALSGPGNSLNLSQGHLCDPVQLPESCQPEIQIPPLPQRKK